MKAETGWLLGITGVVSGMWIGYAQGQKKRSSARKNESGNLASPATTVYYYLDGDGNQVCHHMRPGDTMALRYWGKPQPGPSMSVHFTGLGVPLAVGGPGLSIPDVLQCVKHKDGQRVAVADMEKPIKIEGKVLFDGGHPSHPVHFDAHVGKCIGC